MVMMYLFLYLLKFDQLLVSFSWGYAWSKIETYLPVWLGTIQWCTNPQSRIEGSLTRDGDF